MRDTTSDFLLRLFKNQSTNTRVYNLLTSDEVAALIVGELTNLDNGIDTYIKKKKN